MIVEVTRSNRSRLIARAILTAALIATTMGCGSPDTRRTARTTSPAGSATDREVKHCLRFVASELRRLQAAPAVITTNPQLLQQTDVAMRTVAGGLCSPDRASVRRP
jgi:hypothetical protein